jgi:hypothetical protein
MYYKYYTLNIIDYNNSHSCDWAMIWIKIQDIQNVDIRSDTLFNWRQVNVSNNGSRSILILKMKSLQKVRIIRIENSSYRRSFSYSFLRLRVLALISS